MYYEKTPNNGSFFHVAKMCLYLRIFDCLLCMLQGRYFFLRAGIQKKQDKLFLRGGSILKGLSITMSRSTNAAFVKVCGAGVCGQEKEGLVWCRLDRRRLKALC